MIKNEICKDVNNELKTEKNNEERNNFTFRSRTETYFTHLSAQPLMILLRRLFFSLIRRSRIKEQRVGAHLWYACVRVYIPIPGRFLSHKLSLIMRDKIM